MTASFLRVYRGPEEEASVPTLARNNGGKPCITAPLSEVLPLLADAVIGIVAGALVLAVVMGGKRVFKKA